MTNFTKLNFGNLNQLYIFSFVLLLAFLGSVFVATPVSAAVAPARWIVPKNPKAVVIVIHGGSWVGEKEWFLDDMNPYAQKLSNLSGSATMNIDYRTGSSSLNDVVASYDIARKKFPNLPICAAGNSAGGNLALLLANKRPLNCVISEVGPTNLYTGSEYIKNIAAYHFNKENFRAWSPIYTTKKLRSPTMLVSATNDPIVPHSQALEFKNKFPKAILVTLRPGDKLGTYHVHEPVDSAQLEIARKREANFIKQVAKQYQKTKRTSAVR